MVQHLVALIENKSLDVAQRKFLVANKSIQTARGGDDDVGIGLLVGKKLNILLDGGAAIEDRCLDIRKVLAETGVLVLDLVGQLASVAHDEDRTLAGNWLELVESCEDEHGGLSETRLGLAEDIDV